MPHELRQLHQTLSRRNIRCVSWIRQEYFLLRWQDGASPPSTSLPPPIYSSLPPPFPILLMGCVISYTAPPFFRGTFLNFLFLPASAPPSCLRTSQLEKREVDPYSFFAIFSFLFSRANCKANSKALICTRAPFTRSPSTLTVLNLLPAPLTKLSKSGTK